MPTWVLGVFFLTCVAVCMGQIDSVKNDELEEMWIKFNLKYSKLLLSNNAKA